jgi:hypothetical protein
MTLCHNDEHSAHGLELLSALEEQVASGLVGGLDVDGESVAGLEVIAMVWATTAELVSIDGDVKPAIRG